MINDAQSSLIDQKLQVSNNEQKIPDKKRKIWIIITSFFIVAIFGVAFYYLVIKKNDEGRNSFSENISILPVQSLTPTPFPFIELTIPYLRERSYESSLSDLQQTSSNSNYISYLTSYDSDGFKVNGLLTKPAVEMPKGGFPAIVFVHGYISPANYSTLTSYSSYADFLAKNGFVVFKIDLRGHADSEGEAGGGYFGSDYIIDVLNARSALANSDFVNPEKVGVWGHSMAGNIALRSMVSSDVPAVVIWAGAVYTYDDRVKYGINDSSFSISQLSPSRSSKRQELFEKYGSPSAQSVFWQKVIPTNYLHDTKGAIQMHHAVDDNVVNIGYSRDLMEILDKTPIVHELHEYKNGGHNLMGSGFTQAMERTVEFFKNYLK